MDSQRVHSIGSSGCGLQLVRRVNSLASSTTVEEAATTTIVEDTTTSTVIEAEMTIVEVEAYDYGC